jgi:hypothetical protein
MSENHNPNGATRPTAAPKVQRKLSRMASVRGIVPEFMFHRNLREREARERARRFQVQQEVSRDAGGHARARVAHFGICVHLKPLKVLQAFGQSLIKYPLT